MKVSVLETEDVQQTRATSTTQRCYLQLRELILTGMMEPGEKLKVENLRETLDAGTAPIREALSLLTSDQLVERIDQRGFRTTPVSQAQFIEILRLRCSLEDMALRDSIAESNQQWEEAVVLALHHVNRADRNDVIAFEEKHKRFHMQLLARCQSPILLKFCEQLYDLNIRYRYLAGKSPTYRQRNITDEHDRILDSAIEGNADAASEALLLHYRTTGEFLVENL